MKINLPKESSLPEARVGVGMTSKERRRPGGGSILVSPPWGAHVTLHSAAGDFGLVYTFTKNYCVSVPALRMYPKVGDKGLQEP